jgi:sec-independent protein translocase protein TatB
MLDFSLSEFGIVGAVALLVLGPKDMLLFLKSASEFFSRLKEYFSEYTNYLNQAVNEIESESKIVDVIMDEEGNMQKVYDLSKIMPEIHEDKKDAANE